MKQSEMLVWSNACLIITILAACAFLVIWQRRERRLRGLQQPSAENHRARRSLRERFKKIHEIIFEASLILFVVLGILTVLAVKVAEFIKIVFGSH